MQDIKRLPIKLHGVDPTSYPSRASENSVIVGDRELVDHLRGVELTWTAEGVSLTLHLSDAELDVDLRDASIITKEVSE